MIIPIKWFPNKRLNIKVVTSCILSLALVATPAALAIPNYNGSGNDPSSGRSRTGQGGPRYEGSENHYDGSGNDPSSGRTGTGGATSRGCFGGEMPLTVLASQNKMGRTISRHPTFAWFVPPDSASKQTIFTMYELVPGGKFKEVRTMSLQSSPGVMKVSPLSESEPGLDVGKEYSWQVVILCNPDSPSSALVDGGKIQVVEMPPTLQSQLDNAVNSAEKANIYAEAGLWYDALAEALKLAEPSKLGDVGSALLKDLAKREAAETPPERIKNLERIADRTR